MSERTRRLILPTAVVVLTGIALVVLGAVWKLEFSTVLGSVALGWIAGYHKGANTVLRMIGMSARNAGPRPTTPPRKPADSKASVRPSDFGGRV